VINCFALFRIIMKEAVRRRYITINPCDGIKLPRVEHIERRFLNVDEVETLANAMSDRYRPMVHIGCYLGLRWGEIAGLQLRHVNILKQQLTVAGSLERVGHLSRFAEPKSKAARRLLPLPSFLAESLEDHLASLGGDYLFTSREGGLLNYQNWLRRAWHPAVRAAGLWPFTPHEMRHTAAALMIDQGANMLSLQRRMGHTDIHTTLALYGHLFPETDDLLTQRLDDLRGAYVAQRASNVPQIVDIPG